MSSFVIFKDNVMFELCGRRNDENILCHSIWVCGQVFHNMVTLKLLSILSSILAASAPIYAKSSQARVMTADELEHVYSLCYATKFNATVCDKATVMYEFDKQIRYGFNYRDVADLDRFTKLIKLVVNLQYYHEYRTHEFIENIIKQCDKIADIRVNITGDMQKRSDKMFRWIAEAWNLYHPRDRKTFLDKFVSIRNFFNTFVLWDSKHEYLFGLIVNSYASLRAKFAIRNSDIVNEIDEAAFDIAHLAVNYPAHRIDVLNLKKFFYVHYLTKRTNPSLISFENLFVVVNRTNALPVLTVWQIEQFKFNVHHNVINETIISNMAREVAYVHQTFMAFFDKLNIDYSATPSTSIDVYVHPDRYTYEREGELWKISTNNGGYTHINPDTVRIEAHVYFDRHHTELPLNFGHEIHHALMYAVDDTDTMPDWYVEGSADRYGNQLCYERDHDFIKSHLNVRIEQIVTAEHGSDMLYAMGYALTGFLSDHRSELLANMIRSSNYTFDVDETMNDEFSLYLQNLVDYCDYVIRQRNDKIIKFSTEQEYQGILESSNATSNLFGKCGNFIQFDYKDCAFILTPSRCIRKSKSSYTSSIDALHEIQHNKESVSTYDFEWFQKSLVKFAIIHMLRIICGETGQNTIDFNEIYIKYLPYTEYDFDVDLTCANGSDVLSYDTTRALIEFVMQTRMWKQIPVLGRLTFEQVLDHFRFLLLVLEECDEFVPPVVPLPNLETTLKHYARNLTSNVTPSQEQLVSVRIDMRNNTILHLLAMYRPVVYYNVYRRLYTNVVEMLLNSDNETPQMIYHKNRQYYRKFNKLPHQYCTATSTNYINVQTYKPEKTTISVTEKTEITTNTISKADNENKNLIISLHDSLSTFIIHIVIIVLLITTIVLLVYSVSLTIIYVYKQSKCKLVHNSDQQKNKYATKTNRHYYDNTNKYNHIYYRDEHDKLFFY
nr:ORF132 [Helicoverpa SNPV AC53]WIV85606.1 ORF132 [Helicoverpa SNPV AC53]WIV86443.1 ORF132 [Helicoverpa SNPV AC53]